MGFFSFLDKKTDSEILAQRDRGLQAMRNPTTGTTEKISNGFIAGLTGLGAYLSKSYATELVAEGSRFGRVAKAATSLPGAIIVGVGTLIAGQAMSRYNNKLDGEIAVNLANYDLEKRTGQHIGLEPITAEDLARMKAAKESGQAVGVQTAKALNQNISQPHR